MRRRQRPADNRKAGYRAPALNEAPAARPVARRPKWPTVLRDPAALAILLYTLAAMVAAVAAFLIAFTTFAPYDDEGTLLVTLQAFANGETLYRDVFSPYGPFYHEVFGGLFALFGQTVTTNASRTIVIVLWVGTSLLFGLACQRLTGRLVLGLTAMFAAFAALDVLANEPMHPQVLCVVLLGAFTMIAVLGPGRRPQWGGAAAGATIGALFLTKPNLGAFAIAAVALAAVLTWEPLRRRRWLSWPVIAAVLALPLMVAIRDLGLEWTRNLIAAESLAMAAIVVAAWPLRSPDERDRTLGLWLLAAAAGFAVACTAIMVAIFANGSSPADVYEGMVVEALEIRDANLSEFPMPSAAVDWALAAVAAAAVSVRLRSIGSERAPTIWPGLLRVVAGLAIWLSVAEISLVGLNPSAGNPDSLPAALAWIAAIPPAGVVEPPFKRFLRVLLPALAVAQVLQVYPVPGSQMGIASLAFVPVGALCLGDALTSLREWSAARGGLAPARLHAVVTTALVALAIDFAANAILRPTADRLSVYQDQRALPFPGATELRLPATDYETYVGLVEDIHRYDCTDFIGYPNVNSLYLWSGLEPPRPFASGMWGEVLDSDGQRRIIEQLKASPRPCAIRGEGLADVLPPGQPIHDRPLIGYVLRRFRPVDKSGPYEFMLPIE
jgi:hypothetical protein